MRSQGLFPLQNVRRERPPGSGSVLIFLALAGEMTGILPLSAPALGTLAFLSPLVLLVLFAAALFVDNERIRFGLLCAAFLTTALAIYAGAG